MEPGRAVCPRAHTLDSVRPFRISRSSFQKYFFSRGRAGFSVAHLVTCWSKGHLSGSRAAPLPLYLCPSPPACSSWRRGMWQATEPRADDEPGGCGQAASDHLRSPRLLGEPRIRKASRPAGKTRAPQPSSRSLLSVQTLKAGGSVGAGDTETTPRSCRVCVGGGSATCGIPLRASGTLGALQATSSGRGSIRAVTRVAGAPVTVPRPSPLSLRQAWPQHAPSCQRRPPRPTACGPPSATSTVLSPLNLNTAMCLGPLMGRGKIRVFTGTSSLGVLDSAPRKGEEGRGWGVGQGRKDSARLWDRLQEVRPPPWSPSVLSPVTGA